MLLLVVMSKESCEEIEPGSVSSYQTHIYAVIYERRRKFSSFGGLNGARVRIELMSINVEAKREIQYPRKSPRGINLVQWFRLIESR